jgi:hypothetical protein
VIVYDNRHGNSLYVTERNVCLFYACNLHCHAISNVKIMLEINTQALQTLNYKMRRNYYYKCLYFLTKLTKIGVFILYKYLIRIFKTTLFKNSNILTFYVKEYN